MPDSLEQLAQRILAERAPVLLLDTCSILDVVRVPLRQTRGDLLGAAQRLVNRVHGLPRGLWIVISEQVYQEWQDNAPSVVGEVAATITRTEDAARRLIATARGVAPNQRISGFSLGGMELHNLLLNRSRSLLDGADVLSDDDACHRRAVERMRQRLAPASQGEGFKDCHIVEHFLELARRLRASALTDQIIFVSSNTKDYGASPGRAPLDSEFQAVDLNFVTDIAWAESELGQPEP
jgi:hypothetical protein